MTGNNMKDLLRGYSASDLEELMTLVKTYHAIKSEALMSDEELEKAAESARKIGCGSVYEDLLEECHDNKLAKRAKRMLDKVGSHQEYASDPYYRLWDLKLYKEAIDELDDIPLQKRARLDDIICYTDVLLRFAEMNEHAYQDFTRTFAEMASYNKPENSRFCINLDYFGSRQRCKKTMMLEGIEFLIDSATAYAKLGNKEKVEEKLNMTLQDIDAYLVHWKGVVSSEQYWDEATTFIDGMRKLRSDVYDIRRIYPESCASEDCDSAQEIRKAFVQQFNQRMLSFYEATLKRVENNTIQEKKGSNYEKNRRYYYELSRSELFYFANVITPLDEDEYTQIITNLERMENTYKKAIALLEVDLEHLKERIEPDTLFQ